MADTTPIAQGLMLWALLSLGAGVFGLWWARAPFFRAFWFMTGAWGLVDGAIAFAAWLGGGAEREALRRLLLLNAGLDLGYLALGLFLLSRREARLRGFGAAILVQGGFLLLFDLGHALGV
ncbi:DUF6992 family protein [Thermus sediminis]|uniref:DUF6992 family protein n=1 Tax=Thermus sediminis TaxID=1761908 RepID=UPI001E31C773|nr:hypothetical protein [Thermus sediminis]